MNLSTKQKVIIWATVILIIIFMGFDTKYINTKNIFQKDTDKHISSDISTLSFYGYLIGSISTMLDFSDVSVDNIFPKVLAETRKGLHQFVYIGNYKYYLIVATFLIGFALFIMPKGQNMNRQKNGRMYV